MPFLVIFIVLVWIYILTVLHRAKLTFFKFLVGSVGLFLMMMAIQPYVTAPLAKAVAASTGAITEPLGIAESFYQYSILFIQNGENAITLYIDYECSGVIEMFAFTALIWFFPLYNGIEKTVVNIIGLIWIFASNILRLLSICLLVYFFGNDIYFFAHAILGRIVFYGLSIILYFNVFTKPQIIRQKVGSFGYGGNDSQDI